MYLMSSEQYVALKWAVCACVFPDIETHTCRYKHSVGGETLMSLYDSSMCMYVHVFWMEIPAYTYRCSCRYVQFFLSKYIIVLLIWWTPWWRWRWRCSSAYLEACSSAWARAILACTRGPRWSATKPHQTASATSWTWTCCSTGFLDRYFFHDSKESSALSRAIIRASCEKEIRLVGGTLSSNMAL